MDGKLMENARRVLAQRRLSNETELQERREKVYQRIPEMARIERELRTLVPKAAVTALRRGEDVGPAIDAIARCYEEALALGSQR